MSVEQKINILDARQLVRASIVAGKTLPKEQLLGSLGLRVNSPMGIKGDDGEVHLWLPAELPSMQAYIIAAQQHGSEEAASDAFMKAAAEAQLDRPRAWYSLPTEPGRLPKLHYLIGGAAVPEDGLLVESIAEVDAAVEEFMAAANKAGSAWFGQALYIRVPKPGPSVSPDVKEGYVQQQRTNVAAFNAWLQDQTPEAQDSIMIALFEAIMNAHVPPMEKQAVMAHEVLAPRLRSLAAEHRCNVTDKLIDAGLLGAESKVFAPLGAGMCRVAEVQYGRAEPPSVEGLVLELKGFECGSTAAPMSIDWGQLSKVVINGRTFYGSIHSTHGT